MFMHHPHFGALDTNQLASEYDTLWTREQVLGALDCAPVRLQLWAKCNQTLSTARLDALAHSLSRLPELDVLARAQLTIYLQDDPSFIEAHCEPDALAVYTDWARQFAALGEVAVSDFVRALVLCRVGLYASEDDFTNGDERILMDYKIDPAHSDQILAVRLNQDGGFGTINWES